MSPPLPEEGSALTRIREFQQMKQHISSLQEQVDALYSNLNNLREQQDAYYSSAEPAYTHESTRSLSTSIPSTIKPLSSQSRRRKTIPPFHGVTSSAYGFDVAKSTLQTMGISQEPGLEEQMQLGDRSASASPVNALTAHPTKDPLWMISHQEAVRLCGIYNEEIAHMYPLFDMELITKHITMLWTFLEAALRNGLGQVHLPGADAIDDDDTNIVKMVLAITLTLEGNGQSEMGYRLFESVKPTISAKVIGSTDMKGLVLVIMTVSSLMSGSVMVMCIRR